MNSRKWSLSGALLVFFGLSACGGGGGGNSSGGGSNGGTDTLDLVDGDLKFENETDSFKSYQNPDATARQDACKFSDYYLESENFLVYVDAGQTYAIDDLRTAATKAQLAMDAILPKFGVSWSDFYAMKRIVSFSNIDRFALEVSQLSNGSDPVPPDQISDFFKNIPGGSSQTEVQAFVYNTLVNEENPETVLNVINDARISYNALVGANPDDDSVISQVTPIHEKIQICATSNDRVARSSTSGLKISPDYSKKAYQHESTHLVINQVSNVPAFWAKEGQTHVFLGEAVPASIADLASIRDHLIGTDESEPGSENIDKFKKAYSELEQRDDVDVDAIMKWHRQSMNIKSEWLTDQAGTGEIISDDEREAGIREAFGIVMPISYDVFFDNL